MVTVTRNPVLKNIIFWTGWRVENSMQQKASHGLIIFITVTFNNSCVFCSGKEMTLALWIHSSLISVLVLENLGPSPVHQKYFGSCSQHWVGGFAPSTAPTILPPTLAPATASVFATVAACSALCNFFLIWNFCLHTWTLVLPFFAA